MKKPNQNIHMPRRVAQRILERGANGEKRVVVVYRDGKPSSVWGFDEYLARQKLTGSVKPWKYRRNGSTTSVDPLGAVKGTVRGPITREQMYEEDEV